MDKAKPSLTLAVLTIVTAIFLFDVQGAMIKHMGSQYPVEQIIFFRNCFGIFPSVIALLVMREWHNNGRQWRLSRWKFALSRGLALVGAQLCFYFAIINMQLATATTLAFAGPLFLTTLSVPMLGHKVGIWRTLAVLLGFAGVVLVLQPGSDAFTPIAILPICAAFFYAIASLTSRFFNEDTPTPLINIYASVGSIIGAILLVLFAGKWAPMTTLADWGWFIAMGSTGGMAVLCLITAYRMADPSSLSPFEYFGIPFSFVLGWVFFDEAPFGSLFPGVLLIIGGGLLVFMRERQLSKKVLDEADGTAHSKVE